MLAENYKMIYQNSLTAFHLLVLYRREETALLLLYITCIAFEGREETALLLLYITFIAFEGREDINIVFKLYVFDKEYTFVSNIELFDCMNELVVCFFVYGVLI